MYLTTKSHKFITYTYIYAQIVTTYLQSDDIKRTH